MNWVKWNALKIEWIPVKWTTVWSCALCRCCCCCCCCALCDAKDLVGAMAVFKKVSDTVNSHLRSPKPKGGAKASAKAKAKAKAGAAQWFSYISSASNRSMRKYMWWGPCNVLTAETLPNPLHLFYIRLSPTWLCFTFIYIIYIYIYVSGSFHLKNSIYITDVFQHPTC